MASARPAARCKRSTAPPPAAPGAARDECCLGTLTAAGEIGSSVDGKRITSAGLQPDSIYAGVDAASFIDVQRSDPRVHDVIGIAQHGTVYTGPQEEDRRARR